MTDPDIRRWLGRQTVGEVGLVDYTIVRQGPEAIAAALAKAPETLVIVDAATDDDLVAIGKGARDARLITGGSGIAMALPQIYRERGLLEASVSSYRGVVAPGVVLSGSCSSMTQKQVETYSRDHPHILVSVPDLMAGAPVLQQLLDFALEHRSARPLLYSSADPETVAAMQRTYGREPVADRLEALFGELAVALHADGFGRIVVAGGETSGAVVTALGIHSFALGPEIAQGVPALLARSDKPLAMALKSGNFGDEFFFAKSLQILGS